MINKCSNFHIVDPFQSFLCELCELAVFSMPRFCLRLSLSVNSWMTCVQPNCHLAVHKFSHLFYWKWPSGNLARNSKIKNIYIFRCQWSNGNLNDLCTSNCHSTIHTQTQTQTETGGYRMHKNWKYSRLVRIFVSDWNKNSSQKFISAEWFVKFVKFP